MGLFNKLLSSVPSFFDSEEDPPYFPALSAGNYAAALPLINEAVKQGDPHAMAVLGAMYGMGYGVERDLSEALLWFRQAAVRGDLFAQTALGTCLKNGRGIEKDHQEAAYWLYKAASSGTRVAASILAELVMEDSSVVGKYFTTEDVGRLVMAARKSVGSKQDGNTGTDRYH